MNAMYELSQVSSSYSLKRQKEDAEVSTLCQNVVNLITPPDTPSISPSLPMEAFRFRDAVIEGLSKTGQEGSNLTEVEVRIYTKKISDLIFPPSQVGVDLDAVFKFLVTADNKLDYRRNGEVLLEILVAGGLLAPGGSFQNEGGDKPALTRACVFQDAFDIDRVKAWDQQVFVKLMRKFKYLEKILVEEMKKILVYLKGFTDVSTCC